MIPAQARDFIKIEKTGHHDWDVICPTGWCFEPGRHSQIEFSRKDANTCKQEVPIEECAGNCDCRDEQSP